MILKKWLTGLPMPLYFLLLVLLLHLLPGFWLSVCRAQSSTPTGTALAVGQPVPDITVSDIINHSSSTVRLSDYRGKLLLLDFWATWCGNCKAAMPKLDALQQQFGDRVQVLLVNAVSTRDTAPKVKAYFDKWRRPDGTRYGLPSVVQDTVLSALFPHRLIPHVAWIGPNGKLLATTSADQVTPENIRKALSEGQPPLSQKKDLDLNRPLFSAEGLPAQNLLHYGILLRGWIDGAPSGTRIRRQGKDVVGAALTNTSLLTMFQIAQKALYPELGEKGLLLDVADTTLLVSAATGAAHAAWLKGHAYSYDLVVPPAQAGRLFDYMLEDLNRYSGYRATLEAREQDCLRLVRKGKRDHLQSKGGAAENRLYDPKSPMLRNQPLTQLVAYLNSGSLSRLVVDETGYTGPVDLVLPPGELDLNALRQALRPYGLDLIPGRRKVNLLVLRDR